MKCWNRSDTLQIKRDAGRLSENGYFPQSLRQAQIIILEILQCIPVVIIFAFLDLGKNISFSDNLLPDITWRLIGFRASGIQGEEMSS